MMVKEAGVQTDFGIMDKAQKHNEDGYGVSWYEDDMVKTYKTFNYNTFKGVVRALKQYTIVAHLRYKTRGSKDYTNIHPFEIPSGVMFHNGTISGFGSGTKSDTKDFADMISECDYKYIEDIEPLITPYVNDKINRLVFFEENGLVSIINRSLGIEGDGVWYSNDYHLKDEGWCRTGCKPKIKPANIVVPSKLDNPHLVFVYGTLKRGYRNHSLLSNALYLGVADTVDKWAMIGNNMSFPYMLEEDNKLGYCVRGEVFAVNDKELEALDRLEGIPYHYNKKDIKVRYSDDGSEETVSVYYKANVYDGDRYREYISEWSV